MPARRLRLVVLTFADPGSSFFGPSPKARYAILGVSALF
jgi:hypothetical protein